MKLKTATTMERELTKPTGGPLQKSIKLIIP
jgi:hypothetical protein